MLDANIRAAIKAELTRRGYVEAPAGTTPDLRIVYETASADKIENNPVRVGVGVGSWGGNAGGSVDVGSSEHPQLQGRHAGRARDRQRP